MLEVYKPHTNRFAVGVWLCSAAKRPRKRSALVNTSKAVFLLEELNKSLQAKSANISCKNNFKNF